MWEMKYTSPFVCNTCLIGYRMLFLLTATPAHHSPIIYLLDDITVSGLRDIYY